jgi:hypothetical protein
MDSGQSLQAQTGQQFALLNLRVNLLESFGLLVGMNTALIAIKSIALATDKAGSICCSGVVTT